MAWFELRLLCGDTGACVSATCRPAVYEIWRIASYVHRGVLIVPWSSKQKQHVNSYECVALVPHARSEAMKGTGSSID